MHYLHVACEYCASNMSWNSCCWRGICGVWVMLSQPLGRRQHCKLNLFFHLQKDDFLMKGLTHCDFICFVGKLCSTSLVYMTKEAKSMRIFELWVTVSQRGMKPWVWSFEREFSIQSLLACRVYEVGAHSEIWVKHLGLSFCSLENCEETLESRVRIFHGVRHPKSSISSISKG